jgi:hypothetical protein
MGVAGLLRGHVDRRCNSELHSVESHLTLHRLPETIDGVALLPVRQECSLKLDELLCGD